MHILQYALILARTSVPTQLMGHQEVQLMEMVVVSARLHDLRGHACSVRSVMQPHRSC